MMPSPVLAAYPSPQMAQLLPGAQREVAELGRLIASSPTLGAPSAQPVNHKGVLEVADALLQAASPALGFFFAYPTQRLWKVLDGFAEDAARMTEWLAERPPPNAEEPRVAKYRACCERLQTAIHDWRLSIQLELTAREIEEDQPEMLH